MSDKLVILILSYKPMPEWYRAIGLEQCFRVLGRHPIRMVCPIGLDVSAYWRIAPALKVDFIPSQWLSSRSEKPYRWSIRNCFFIRRNCCKAAIKLRPRAGCRGNYSRFLVRGSGF